MKLDNYIRSSFTKWIDFKSRAGRFEFFVGLATSGIFFLFNAILFMKLNSYANYLRDMTLPLVSYFYILIATLFTFMQCHSLVARRLNDISVNPYNAFIPFLLTLSHLFIKSFYYSYKYDTLILLIILLVIASYSTLMVWNSDWKSDKQAIITILWFILCFLYPLDTFADSPREIKSNELKWVPFSKQKVAKDVYRAILKKENIEDNEIYDELVAFVDLNYDKKDEIVVKSQRLGGAFLDAYVFFENKNNKWQHILTFTGGFILNNQHPDWFNKKYSDKDKMYHTITQWQRFGGAETWQNVFVYKGDKYVFINEQRVPLTVLYQKDFQKMLLEINGHPLSGYWN